MFMKVITIIFEEEADGITGRSDRFLFFSSKEICNHSEQGNNLIVLRLWNGSSGRIFYFTAGWIGMAIHNDGMARESKYYYGLLAFSLGSTEKKYGLMGHLLSSFFFAQLVCYS